jgi:phospholipid/cholesterol/gamma-HCH transport system ATP-binding protein
MEQAEAHATKDVIELENVSKTLEGKPVLDGLSMAVRSGETLVILGGSGAGKSVTLKHMVGLMRPDAGSVRIGGEDITDYTSRELEPIRRRFGYCFQGAALLNSLSVFENVALPLRETEPLSEGDLAGRVAEVLRLVRLEDAAQKMPAVLSGGMRKRAGLARALVRRPQIVLYDEPTAGLDPVTARAIDELVLDLRRQLGVTSVVVTHDIESAFRVGTRLAMLYRGRIHLEGPPDLFRSTTDPLVRQFVDGRLEGPLGRE